MSNDRRLTKINSWRSLLTKFFADENFLLYSEWFRPQARGLHPQDCNSKCILLDFYAHVAFNAYLFLSFFVHAHAFFMVWQSPQQLDVWNKKIKKKNKTPTLLLSTHHSPALKAKFAPHHCTISQEFWGMRRLKFALRWEDKVSCSLSFIHLHDILVRYSV